MSILDTPTRHQGLQPWRTLTDKPIMARYRFFRKNADYIVGHSAVCAMRLAKAEARGEDLGLTVDFQPEIEPWDGDFDPPPIHVWGFVKALDGTMLASLGSIGLTSWHDTYVRVVSAEIMLEALEELDRTKGRTR